MTDAHVAGVTASPHEAGANPACGNVAATPAADAVSRPALVAEAWRRHVGRVRLAGGEATVPWAILVICGASAAPPVPEGSPRLRDRLRSEIALGGLRIECIGGPADAPADARTRALMLAGETDRARYAATIRPPAALRVLDRRHYGPDAALCPGTLVAMFEDEEARLPLGPNAPEEAVRRLHVFETPAPGTVLALTTLGVVGAAHVPTSMTMSSFLSRLGDGAVVALCEVTLR